MTTQQKPPYTIQQDLKDKHTNSKYLNVKPDTLLFKGLGSVRNYYFYSARAH